MPGYTINRFCSSGVQAVADAAARIRLGDADVMIAGGTESMSIMSQMMGNKIAMNPAFFEKDENLAIAYGMGFAASVAETRSSPSPTRRRWPRTGCSRCRACSASDGAAREKRCRAPAPVTRRSTLSAPPPWPPFISTAPAPSAIRRSACATNSASLAARGMPVSVAASARFGVMTVGEREQQFNQRGTRVRGQQHVA